MSKEPIHSGHFMTSNPHSEISPDDEDEDVEVILYCKQVLRYIYFVGRCRRR